MKMLSEIMDVPDNADREIDLEQNIVLNKIEKRPLETSEEDVEGEQKKCKIDDEDSRNDSPAVSKRKLKKMKKQQQWLEKKALRKEVNKEKKDEKKKWKAQMREAGVEIQKAKTTKMAQSTCKQRVVLDMSYDDMMSNKEKNIKFVEEVEKHEVLYNYNLPGNSKNDVKEKAWHMVAT